jgi:hypothetical protein
MTCSSPSAAAHSRRRRASAQAMTGITPWIRGPSAQDPLTTRSGAAHAACPTGFVRVVGVTGCHPNRR